MLSIIVVNYNTRELTCCCIDSIYHNSYEDIEIIIVDNASTDGSKDFILAKFPQIVWIDSGGNIGFGRANNLGIEAASSEMILLLNSDMILMPDTIENCLAAMKSDPSIGALGCRLLNEDGSDQKSTYSYIGDHEELLRDNHLICKLKNFKELPVKAIMGSFFLTKKDVLEKSGVFDTDFFMYCEELDLCDRITKAGYRIEYRTSATAIHKHGGSSSNDSWRTRQIYLSRALLVWKKKGYWGYLLSLLIMILNTMINFPIVFTFKREFLQGFVDQQKAIFSNTLRYILIPFKFGRGYNRSIQKNPLRAS
jgi:GT2 family glycosyltransferase